jgi:hypothetical protein
MPATAAARPELPSRAELLAQAPEAAQWARDCAWVPGTGHCRNRECGRECSFYPQRAAETARIMRWRRLRRIFARR